jgi:hypothetical protein
VLLLAGVVACSKRVDPKSPVCSVSVDELAFGNVSVGQVKDLSFSVRNVGGGTMWIVLRTCEGDSGRCEPCHDFAIHGDSNVLITGGAFATVTIRFAPSGAGFRSCFVDFFGDCPPVALNGSGVASAGNTARP